VKFERSGRPSSGRADENAKKCVRFSMKITINDVCNILGITRFSSTNFSRGLKHEACRSKICAQYAA